MAADRNVPARDDRDARRHGDQDVISRHDAVEAGDVVLVRSDPRDVPRIIALSKATDRKMIQNLWWAAGYNIVAIPLAARVLAPWGIVLPPAVGAVLMSLSTIIVAINAQLLRRARL
jgi:Cu2+-exporting ATPase